LHKKQIDGWEFLLIRLIIRFKITGMVPIYLEEEVQMFDTVQTRFDGANCWFEADYRQFTECISIKGSIRQGNRTLKSFFRQARQKKSGKPMKLPLFVR